MYILSAIHQDKGVGVGMVHIYLVNDKTLRAPGVSLRNVAGVYLWQQSPWQREMAASLGRP